MLSCEKNFDRDTGQKEFLSMDGYRKMYAIECLSRGQAAQAKDILTAAQCEAEELFIAGAAEPERQLKA